ncbi:type I restriction endonuclease subunit R [Leuconostoc palmae]|uniref:type I restriction endonuclease subunit R n=1 Tax=Leuconostoc palmae TaxID=501487 RepID=UPI001C7E044A|nr:type I restriction endonuclease subunit R [Leuconostoc palmae]
MAFEDHLSEEVKKLIDRAEEEITQKNWHDASETLMTIYESVGNFDVNYRLVNALAMDEQYQLAASYADDFLTDYLEKESDFRLIVTLAIKNQNFVYAQQLVSLCNNAAMKQTLIENIRHAEQIAKDTMSITFQTISRQFYHLSDYDIVEQRDRYESARHLPIEEFVTGAKYLLVDPYVTPIIRATLLEDLQKLNVTETITYRWLDNELYNIKLDTIPLLTESKIFEVVAELLDEKLGHDDPVAIDILAQQVRFEMTLIYPKVDEIITEPEEWVNASIDKYYDKDSDYEPSKQKKWHQHVRELIASFF